MIIWEYELTIDPTCPTVPERTHLLERLFTNFVWTGLIINECLTRRRPFGQYKFSQQIYYAVSVKAERPEISSDAPAAMQKLIQRCWNQVTSVPLHSHPPALTAQVQTSISYVALLCLAQTEYHTICYDVPDLNFDRTHTGGQPQRR
jgi:hypothetical protein